MPGEIGSPYRAPCGGWPVVEKVFDGGPFQHFRSAENAIPQLVNDTKVTDWHSSPDPDGIDPFPRPADPDELPTCAAVVDCGGADEPPCGPWPEPPPANTFTQTGTVDSARCLKVGRKQVQAARTWHGRYGFLSHDEGECDDIRVPCSEGPYESELPAPSQTRYLTQSVDFNEKTYDQDGTTFVNLSDPFDPRNGQLLNYCEKSGQLTVTVDPLSGVWQIVSCTLLARYANYNSDGTFDQYFQNPGCSNADFAWGTYVNQMRSGCEPQFYRDELAAIDLGEQATTDRTVSDTEHHIEIHRQYTTVNGGTFDSYTFDTTITLSDENPWSDVRDDIINLLSKWPMNDDLLLPFRLDDNHTVAQLVTRNEAGSPVSPDRLLTDCADTDPNEDTYDGSIRGAPEQDGEENYFYGRDRYFDGRHLNWDFCLDEESNPQWYVKDYGAYNPNYLPGTVTQWTDRFAATFLIPPGAFIGRIARVTDDGLAWHPQIWAQKYCETKIPLPSQNFFKPAGPLRFAIDETKKWCIESISGDEITLESLGDPPVVSGSEPYIVCDNGGDHEGVWEVTQLSDWVIRLDTKIYDLPAGYTQIPPDAAFSGSGVFGLVRWPNAYPILGRIAVESATQSGGDVDIVLASPCVELRTGDHVDFSGVGGLGSDVPVTVTDPTHLTVTGTLSSSPTSGGFVSSHGAPNYYWNDTKTKGDYLVMQWFRDFRDYAERDRVIADYAECLAGPDCDSTTCADVAPASSDPIRPDQFGHGMPRDVSNLIVTAACLAFTPCGPSVICISPNGESWDSGTTYDFPDVDDCVPDFRYGGQVWQSIPVQFMHELYWQEPRRPCVDDHMLTGSEGKWLSDDGSCLADAGGSPPTYFYPTASLVEARETLPASAPSLPAGIVLHHLTISELNSGSVPDGIVAAPPERGGNLDLPFNTWLNEIASGGCIVEEGRFGEIYKAYYD